jgi:hypothetical protein
MTSRLRRVLHPVAAPGRAAASLAVAVAIAGATVVLPVSPGAQAATTLASLPAACAPTASLAKVVGARRPVTIAVQGASNPVKDLGMQPLSLTLAQQLSLLDLAKQAGVGVINTGVSWATAEPDGSHLSSTVWRTLTQFVANVRARGMAVRFQLYGLPQWARDSADPDNTTAPWQAPQGRAELGRWAAWINTVVKHFGTTVSFYEIWNEENTQVFWAQGPSPVTYAALLACSYVAAKRANPRSVIITGGLSTNDVGYLQHLYSALDAYPNASAFRDFFDLLGVHPYSGGRSPDINSSRWTVPSTWGADDTNFLGFVELHAVMAAHGQGYKQIYIGEYGAPVTGYGTDTIGGFTQIPETTRSAYVTLAYRLAATHPYVVALSWYAFYPDQFDPPAWALVRNPDGSIDATTQWTLTSSFASLSSVASARLAGA